jgi:hypothetical protein
MTLKARVGRLEQKSPRNRLRTWQWPQDARTIARALAFAIERRSLEKQVERDE